MSKIIEINARKIFDSREKETIEVLVRTDEGIQAIDSVPSGTSTGESEAALVTPDEAVKYVNTIIAKEIIGKEVTSQQDIDSRMIELDGTANKSRLGANSILGVSLACARAASLSSKMPLYWYLNRLFRKISMVETEPLLPTPMMVMICGGKHGGNKLCVQEFLVIGEVSNGIKIWEKIGEILKNRKIDYTLGLEGAYSPNIDKDEQAIEIIQEAIQECGLVLGKDVKMGLDVAGNNCEKTNEEIISLFTKYNLYSLEDPFGEKNWEKFGQLKLELGKLNKDYLLIGDDLFATHKNLLQKGINDLVANGIIIKVNQVGTLTEAMEVVSIAKKANYKCIVSHRSGETTDTFIADLSVGISAEYLKSGTPIPKERKLKYQRLEEIENEL